MTTRLMSRGRSLTETPNGLSPPVWHDFRPFYRVLVPNQGWVTFIVLYFMTLSVTWSVESAEWTRSPSLPWAALAGLVTGLALAKIRLHGLILQGLALMAGLLAILWLVMRFVGAPSLREGVAEVGQRLGTWTEAAISDGVSTDPMPFALALVVLVWLLGYLSAWFAFRYRNIWVPLALGGIGILTNLSYLPSRHWSYFYMFLIFAMLAVAWMSILERRRSWTQQRIPHSPYLSWFGISDAFLFTLAVVIVAAFVPTGIPRPSVLQKGYEYLRWPVEEFQGDFNRLFAAVPARKPLPYRIFDTTLPFRGTISLSDEVIFTVKSPRPSYWRARSYSTYTSQGWFSADTRIVPVDWQPEVAEPVSHLRRAEVQQQVTLSFSPRVLMATGIARESNVGAVVEVPAPLIYTVSLLNPQPDQSLPLDVQEMAAPWRLARQERQTGLTVQRIRNELPEDLELVDIEFDATGIPASVTMARPVPVPLDILSIRSQKRLFSSDKYSVTSSVSVATAEELRDAGEDYTGWVRDLYLQLPDSLPQRVIDLAQGLAKEAESPYGKAIAIRDYLRTLPYTVNIPPPAYDGDGVDHFLFGVGAGYSEYFASALAVMLRAVDVPTRLAVGYGPGEIDEQGTAAVRDRNGHAWTEVYFPGYGWVDFEPTPGRSFPVQEAERSETLFDGRTGFDDDQPEGEGFAGLAGRGGLVIEPNKGLGLLWAVWGLLGAGLMFIGWLAALVLRRLVGAPVAAAGVYGKMVRLSNLAGLGPNAGQTPQEYGRSLAQGLPGIRREVELVVNAYSKDRYGSRVLSKLEQSTVLEAWRSMRRTLFARLLRRWRR